MPRNRSRRQPAETVANDRRSELLEQRLTVPVIIAAAVSVPAVFLTTVGEGAVAAIGTALNWASLAVLTGESVLLFVLTGDRMRWLRRHRWSLAIVALAIPAVLFAIAPVQALRLVFELVRFIGALRILRANRIMKAGRILGRRSGLAGGWRHLPILAGIAVAVLFVGLVLADPAAVRAHRQALHRLLGWSEALAGVTAVAVVITVVVALAGAVWLTLRCRRRQRDLETDSDDLDP